MTARARTAKGMRPKQPKHLQPKHLQPKQPKHLQPKMMLPAKVAGSSKQTAPGSTLLPAKVSAARVMARVMGRALMTARVMAKGMQPKQPKHLQPKQPKHLQPKQPKPLQPKQPKPLQPKLPKHLQPKQPKHLQQSQSQLPPRRQRQRLQPPLAKTTRLGVKPRDGRARSSSDEPATGLPRTQQSGASESVLTTSLPLPRAPKPAELALCKAPCYTLHVRTRACNTSHTHIDIHTHTCA